MQLAANPDKLPASNPTKPMQVFENESEILTEDYKINSDDRYMLLGYYRNEAHLNWILQNKLYNVRLGDRRGALRGMNLRITPSRIVLYTNGKNEEPVGIRIFTVNQSEVLVTDKQKMEDLKYPAGSTGIGESYKLFSLGTEIKNHKKLDIKKIKTDSGRSEKSYRPLFVRY